MRRRVLNCTPRFIREPGTQKLRLKKKTGFLSIINYEGGHTNLTPHAGSHRVKNIIEPSRVIFYNINAPKNLN